MCLKADASFIFTKRIEQYLSYSNLLSCNYLQAKKRLKTEICKKDLLNYPQSCAAFVAFCNANLLKVMMIINITQLVEINCE